MKATSTIIAIICAILAIVFGALWISASGKAKSLTKTNAEFQKTDEAKSSAVDDLMPLAGLLNSETGTIDAGSELPAGTPEEKLQYLKNSITSATNQIAQLKKERDKLQQEKDASRSENSNLQSMIKKLNASIAEKERWVSELQGKLANAQSELDSERQLSQAEISKRDAQIKDKETIINNQNVDNNRLYYVVGTRKQLIEKGIIDRKGGILGIGRVSTVKDADLDKFTEFNLLETQQITFPATKKGYSVLSNHVAASYRVERKDDQYILTVTDQNQFRKQKILVIELK